MRRWPERILQKLYFTYVTSLRCSLSGLEIFISAENSKYFLHPFKTIPDSSSMKSKNGDISQITYTWTTLIWLCGPQDTKIHPPFSCFCLPVTSFFQMSDAAKHTARALENVPTEMLTKSCTECFPRPKENAIYCQIDSISPFP